MASTVSLLAILQCAAIWACMTCIAPSVGQEVQPTAAGGATVTPVTNPRIIEHPEDQYVSRTDPATLNCKAEGDPPPVITWYRDGVPVVTANENPSSHRMLLPSGQLFFLKVIHNKNSRPDVGTYYCNATNPETKVSVISRTAKLEIAVIRDEFREQPLPNVEVALGATATLNCRPPTGLPEPRILWEKDGERLRTSSLPSERVTVSEFGTLQVRDVRRDDVGLYVCVAYNIAGEKRSNPSRLIVREKPVIVQGPKDTTVSENADVLLQCQATGDPQPVIAWKKREGQIPAERIQFLSDHSLRIENAQVGDEGNYVCRSENPYGFAEAEARLTIHSRPLIVIPPRDKVAAVGRRLTIRCVVTGNPQPAVFWSRVNSQTFMFPNQNNGRFKVLEDGSLVIDSIQREDAGEYSCQALSMSGSAFANVRIEVTDSDPRPPPIIYHGPQNQTLPIGNSAFLPCLASGEPAPTIEWFKGPAPLTTHDPRISVHVSGTLEFSELQTDDTGVYTCKATSETGETTWSAGLIVETPENHHIVFHRTPESSTFPGVPQRPIISDVSETSLRLTWKPNANSGASPVILYTVEYFSHDTGEGWVVASNTVTESTYVVRQLQPATSYMFLVRAQNSHGLSLPSAVTAVVKTKGERSQLRPTTPPLDPQLVSEKLAAQVVFMHAPEVLSSSAIKLSWELRYNQQFVEGFHIRYRIVPDLDSSDGGQQQRPARNRNLGEYTVVTVQSPTATMYVLSDLQKFTYYEVRIQPFYRTVLGTESNLFRVRTLPDRPSAPPQNVHVVLMENETLSLTWSAPPKQHRNGLMLGYKIFLIANEPRYSREIQLNTSVESYYYRHLAKDITYRIQILAFNDVGDGVRSEPIIVGRQPGEAKSPLINEPWFIATLISVVGAAVWLVLCLFSIWLYRRYKANKKVPKNRSVPGEPIYKFEDNGRLGHTANQMPLLATASSVCDSNMPGNHLPPYANGGYRGNQPCVPQCCYDNESPSDGDSKATGSLIGHTYQTLESLQHGAVNSHNGVAVPYASTTLIGAGGPATAHRNGVNTGGGGGCIPNPQAYMIQPSSTLTAATSAFDTRLNGSEQRIEQAGYQCQPMLFLPPPPDHSDQGTLPVDNKNYGTSSTFQCDNNLRRLNAVDERGVLNGRIYSATYSEMPPPPVLEDPQFLNFDPYGDCRGMTDAEMPVELMLGESDSASVSSSEGSFTAGDDIIADAVNCSNSVDLERSLQQDLTERAHRPAHRHRQRAPRPASPYSTDSNYSAAVGQQQQRNQYPPRSRRKKQSPPTGLTAVTANAASELEPLNGRNQSPLATSDCNRLVNKQTPNDDLIFTKPPPPYSTANSSRSGNSGGCSTSSIYRAIPGTLTQQTNNGSIARLPSECGGDISSRLNPLSAFDTRDKPRLVGFQFGGKKREKRLTTTQSEEQLLQRSNSFNA